MRYRLESTIITNSLLKSRRLNKISIYSILLACTFLKFVNAIAQDKIGQGSPTFTIATFNIKNFSIKTLTNLDNVQKLSDIIRRYDIVAVQEISDKSNILAGRFLTAINNKGMYHYAYTCSERTGKQADDKKSQEQYAFYYNTDQFELIGQPVLYNDEKNDLFQREPYIAMFKTRNGNSTFIVITIHTAPKKAVEEIGSLNEVTKWAKNHFSQDTNIVILGDFNGSCRYASPEKLNTLKLRGPDYYWIVPDSAKTNLSSKQSCAYDRIVITPSLKQYFTGHWAVDTVQINTKMSDHFPVWAEFYYKTTTRTSN